MNGHPGQRWTSNRGSQTINTFAVAAPGGEIGDLDDLFPDDPDGSGFEPDVVKRLFAAAVIATALAFTIGVFVGVQRWRYVS